MSVVISRCPVFPTRILWWSATDSDPALDLGKECMEDGQGAPGWGGKTRKPASEVAGRGFLGPGGRKHGPSGLCPSFVLPHPLGWGTQWGPRLYMMAGVRWGACVLEEHGVLFFPGQDTLRFQTQTVNYPIFQMQKLRHGGVKTVCPRPQS